MKFAAACWSFSLAVSSSAEKGRNTGLWNIQRKREASPLSTLLLSTMSGIAVDGWVMPQSVKQVRGISKFALPPTFKNRMMCLLTKMYLVHYLSKMVNVMGMETNEHAWCVIFDLVIKKLVPIFFFFFSCTIGHCYWKVALKFWLLWGCTVLIWVLQRPCYEVFCWCENITLMAQPEWCYPYNNSKGV